MGLLIGVSGKARTGKDSVGMYLSDRCNFNITSFAFSLKEAVKIIYGWTDDHVYGSFKEKIDPYWEQTPREVMQKFGTDACRNNMRKDLWVKSLEKRIIGDTKANWVITDVRFPDEIDFIHRLGGFVVRLNRNNPDQITNGTMKHESEIALDNFNEWDDVIQNNGTFNELFENVDKSIDLFKKTR